MSQGTLGAVIFWVGLLVLAVQVVRRRVEYETRLRALERGQALDLLRASRAADRREEGMGFPYRSAASSGRELPVLWTPEREAAARAAGARAELAAVLRIVRSMAEIERELRARGVDVRDATAAILALLEDRERPLPVPPAPPPPTTVKSS